MTEGVTFVPPEPTAKFRLARGVNVVFHLTCRYPSAWQRFWQRVFFGFEWERIGPEDR